MKTRGFLAFSICLFMFALAYATDESGITGKWATDPVRTAKTDKKDSSITGRIFQTAGDAVARQVPSGSGRGPGGGAFGGGGRGGGRGGVQIDTSAPIVVERGSSPDGIALILELKVSKAKLAGRVTEVVSGAKFDVENPSLMGNKFQFVTYKKVSSVKIATVYKGELVDESTIAITRWTDGGKAIDLNEDGSPQTLTFRRAK